VARIVGDLKEIAIDMGTEVAKQNVQIDKINEKASLTAQRVDMADKRTKDLINS
jgi:hypothetical protein